MCGPQQCRQNREILGPQMRVLQTRARHLHRIGPLAQIKMVQRQIDRQKRIVRPRIDQRLHQITGLLRAVVGIQILFKL